jgi:integrase
MQNALTNPANFDPQTFALEAIQNNPRLQPSTKHQYTKAIKNYLATGASLTNPEALSAYAGTVGTSTAAFLKAAVRTLAVEVAHEVKSGARVGMSGQEARDMQAMIYRADALQDAIKTKATKGSKAHTWLNQSQVADLLRACDRRKSGKPDAAIVAQRDRLAIGLLVAAGLRREEAVNLKFSDIQLQPVGDKMRTVLNVTGKGAKDRIIPISDQLANALSAWGAVVGGSGFVLRSLGRNKQAGESMSAVALYNIVAKRGGMIGKENLQPHDLRRTFAQLGHEAGITITQISTLLGHANLETTQRYLNLQIDLKATISDFIPFEG